jgi:pimeloyl-ACP methyl ester carboxylesterase
MYVERYGSGRQRWLGLHGWSGDHRTFEPLLPYLPEGVTLYAPDLPGCGRSPAPQQWRLAAVTRELVALVGRLTPPPLTVIGNCSGALLGLCLARELCAGGQAERIERLVLIDPFAYWPWYFRVFASETIGPYALACSFGNPLGRRLVNLALAGKRRRQTDLTEGFAGLSPDVPRAWLRMLREIRSPEEFACLRLPIRVLHGERTFAAVRRSLRLFRPLWPQLECRPIAGAGHLPLKEAPQAVAASILV